VLVLPRKSSMSPPASASARAEGFCAARRKERAGGAVAENAGVGADGSRATGAGAGPAAEDAEADAKLIWWSRRVQALQRREHK